MDPADAAGPVVLARRAEAHGEVVLRRRGEVFELIVDGGFAMDTVDPSTERALAGTALGVLSGESLQVVVGGLGLGFTLAAVLADPRVRRVQVIESSAAVVEWVAAGLVPATAGVLSDPRVRISLGDVRQIVPELPPAGTDALLLDVDNGPGFLLHPGNAEVYGERFLATVCDQKTEQNEIEIAVHRLCARRVLERHPADLVLEFAAPLRRRVEEARR